MGTQKVHLQEKSWKQNQKLPKVYFQKRPISQCRSRFHQPNLLKEVNPMEEWGGKIESEGAIVTDSKRIGETATKKTKKILES